MISTMTAKMEMLQVVVLQHVLELLPTKLEEQLVIV
jgi:hypothetical protein